jgi:hypothetical protein
MAKLTNSPTEATVLELEARKSFALSIALEARNGAPADLTGASVTFVLGLPDGAAVEVPAVIDLPLGGVAVVPLQADHLDLPAGSYPFVVVLVTGGYSLVVVKGEVALRENPEHDSIAAEYGGAHPSTGLAVVLQGLQVVRVTLWTGVPAGVDGGLDATGVSAGLTPVAQGDGTWAWAEPPVSIDWSEVTGTEAVVLRPELDAYARLDGATFTGDIAVPGIVTDDLQADFELRVGPEDQQVKVAYGTISGAIDGLPTEVSFPTGIDGLPTPTVDDHAAPKGYVDDLIESIAGGSGNKLVGYAQNVTSSGAVGSTTPAAVLIAANVSLLAGRRYRAVFTGATDGTVAADLASLHILAGSTQIQMATQRANSGTAAGQSNGFTMDAIWTAEATGPLNISGRLARALGTGTVRVVASATAPMTLTVELMDEDQTNPGFDSGWVDIVSFSSGFALSTGSGVPPTVQFRKVGSQVFARGRASGTLTVNTTHAVGTVPAAMAPTLYTVMGVATTTGGFLGWASVNPAGVLSVHFKSPWATGSGVIDFTPLVYPHS